MGPVEPRIPVHKWAEQEMTHAVKFSGMYGKSQKAGPFVRMQVDKNIIMIPVQRPSDMPECTDRIVFSFFIYRHKVINIGIIADHISQFFINDQSNVRTGGMTAQNLQKRCD